MERTDKACPFPAAFDNCHGFTFNRRLFHFGGNNDLKEKATGQLYCDSVLPISVNAEHCLYDLLL